MRYICYIKINTKNYINYIKINTLERFSFECRKVIGFALSPGQTESQVDAS